MIGIPFSASILEHRRKSEKIQRYGIKALSILWLGIAWQASAITIPAGTMIDLRLTTEVSSEKASGQAVSAVVIAAVLVNGTPAIGQGTQLDGVTADANPNKPAADGNAEQPATVRIQLTKIHDKGGQSKAVFCVLAGIDNAREAVDQSGLITGIKSSQTFTSLADSGVNKVTEKNEQLGQLLSGLKNAIVKRRTPQSSTNRASSSL